MEMPSDLRLRYDVLIFELWIIEKIDDLFIVELDVGCSYGYTLLVSFLLGLFEYFWDDSWDDA